MLKTRCLTTFEENTSINYFHGGEFQIISALDAFVVAVIFRASFTVVPGIFDTGKQSFDKFRPIAYRQGMCPS